MNELISVQDRNRDLRWHLLTTVSALALLATVCGASESRAADQDSDRPTVWIELGGQFESLSDSQEQFAPPFLASITNKSLLSALNVQRQPAFALSEEGTVSFQPRGSDWLFSVSIRFGRSQSEHDRHQQTQNAKIPVNVNAPASFPPPFGGENLKYGFFYPSQRIRFADGKARLSESHTVLDFQAGKDVGLGIFGGHGSSVLSAGVRFAQFVSNASISLHAVPDLQYPTAPITSLSELEAFKSAENINFHAYTALAQANRSFRGLGPSLAWKASAPFAGNSDRGEISFDWGVNGAVLFGRQKAQVSHQTTALNYHVSQWNSGQAQCPVKGPSCRLGGDFNDPEHPSGHATLGKHNVASFDRNRGIVVPNLGGFAGFSFLYSNAKLSFGYRADFFLGAMDGGINTTKSETLGFHGPFATISIGLP